MHFRVEPSVVVIQRTAIFRSQREPRSVALRATDPVQQRILVPTALTG